MHAVLASRPPWWVVGPSLGLLVVLVQATINDQLGVLGGFTAAVERASGRSSELRWKGFFVLGVVLGGMLFGVLSGRLGTTSYGWLTRTFTGSRTVVTSRVELSEAARAPACETLSAAM